MKRARMGLAWRRELWSLEQRSNQHEDGLAWQCGRECLSVYLAGINLVSVSTTLYFSFSFFIRFFVFFFLNKILFLIFFFFFFFLKIYMGWVNGSWFWRGQGKGVPKYIYIYMNVCIYIFTENLPTKIFFGPRGLGPLGPPPEWVRPCLNG